MFIADSVEVPGQYLLVKPGAAKSSKKQKDSWGVIVAGTSSGEDLPDVTGGGAATAPSGLPGPAGTSLPGPAGAEDAGEDFVPCTQQQGSQESLSGTRQKTRAQVIQVPLPPPDAVSLTGSTLGRTTSISKTSSS